MDKFLSWYMVLETAVLNKLVKWFGVFITLSVLLPLFQYAFKVIFRAIFLYFGFFYYAPWVIQFLWNFFDVPISDYLNKLPPKSLELIGYLHLQDVVNDFFWFIIKAFFYWRFVIRPLLFPAWLLTRPI